MTSDKRLAILTGLRTEFYADKTTDERRIEILKQVRAYAQEELPGVICTSCMQALIYCEWNRPLVEGHIYSKAGADEVHITKMCEYCFDKATLERDDPRRAEWFGE